MGKKKKKKIELPKLLSDSKITYKPVFGFLEVIYCNPIILFLLVYVWRMLSI